MGSGDGEAGTPNLERPLVSRRAPFASGPLWEIVHRPRGLLSRTLLATLLSSHCRQSAGLARAMTSSTYTQATKWARIIEVLKLDSRSS